MVDISAHADLLQRLCSELGVRHLSLVGSAARADFDPTRSDVDIMVSFEGDANLFDRYFDLKARLEGLLGRPVDLIQTRAVRNPIVKRNMERDKVLLYGT